MGEVARGTLIAVVVLLAFIGFLHLTRGTAVKHVRGVGADGAPVAVSEPEFALSVAMLTGASLAIREPRRRDAKWRRYVRTSLAGSAIGAVVHHASAVTTGIRDGWGTR